MTLVEAWCHHRPGLVRFLARRLRCEATAKDIAQEIWLRLQRVNRLATDQNPRALLFQIAANLATDHYRVQQRRMELDAEIGELLSDERDEASPEHLLMAAQELAQLEQVVDQLPERSREVFRMNRFEGYSQREIAERLGISVTAVEKHLRKAFARLAALRTTLE
ncbi:RNA polymerase sigma factor [Steroidobacter flavus]|uniref:RNA polymerase sigma factor n=1 Tax=Steroidobacter flavus TaxID=1842136 RepID=A0ABV8T4B0_9GAMM